MSIGGVIGPPWRATPELSAEALSLDPPALVACDAFAAFDPVTRKLQRCATEYEAEMRATILAANGSGEAIVLKGALQLESGAWYWPTPQRTIEVTKALDPLNRKDRATIATSMARSLSKPSKASEVSMLNAAGVKGGIVDVGGNIVVVGQKPDGSPWRIGIQHPTEPRGKYCGIVEIEGGCVVTSGVYERYFELDGKRYHHILDTETGYPVEGPLLSVSLLARDSLTADALSTAVFAAGLPAGHELVLKTDGLEAIFILKGLRVLVTPGLRDTFTLTDPSFELAESGN